MKIKTCKLFTTWVHEFLITKFLIHKFLIFTIFSTDDQIALTNKKATNKQTTLVLTGEEKLLEFVIWELVKPCDEQIKEEEK